MKKSVLIKDIFKEIDNQVRAPAVVFEFKI